MHVTPEWFGRAREIGVAKRVRCEKKVNGVNFKNCLKQVKNKKILPKQV
jgi:hypothetical protein